MQLTPESWKYGHGDIVVLKFSISGICYHVVTAAGFCDVKAPPPPRAWVAETGAALLFVYWVEVNPWSLGSGFGWLSKSGSLFRSPVWYGTLIKRTRKGKRDPDLESYPHPKVLNVAKGHPPQRSQRKVGIIIIIIVIIVISVISVISVIVIIIIMIIITWQP